MRDVQLKPNGLSIPQSLQNIVYSTEEFIDGEWIPIPPISTLYEHVFFGTHAVLRHAYHEPHHSIQISGTATEPLVRAKLNFAEGVPAFVGTLERHNGDTVTIRGTGLTSVFSTNRSHDAEPLEWKPWKTLSIATRWDDSSGTPELKITYLLGEEDISNRTTVTKIDKSAGTTTIEMVASLEPIGGAEDSFTIELAFGGDAFTGKYRPTSEMTYRWAGLLDPEKKAGTLSKLQVPASIDSGAAAVGGSLSLQELDNVSSISVVTSDTGKEFVVDFATKTSGDYFNKCLVNGLPGDWAPELYGHKFILPDGVSKVFDQNKEFFQSNSVLASGQMLYDNFSETGLYGDLLKKIEPEKLKSAWEDLGKSIDKGPAYQAATSALYIEGYKLIPGMIPYLSDAASWGEKYFNWLCSDAVILQWQIQIKSSMFANVKTRIYEWYTKLQVLAPDKDYGKRYTTIAYSALLGVFYTGAQWSEDMLPFLDAIVRSAQEDQPLPDIMTPEQKTAAREIQTLLRFVITKGDKVAELVKAMSDGFREFLNKNKGATLQQAAASNEAIQLIGNGLQGEQLTAWNDLTAKGKIKGVLGTMAYGAAAGFLIYMIVDNSDKPQTPLQVFQEISLGILAAAALVKGIQKLMSLGVGRFLTNFAEASGGAFRDFAGAIAKWFTAEGVQPIGKLGKALVAVFGESSAKFMSTRVAPALAVIGLVVAAFFLYQSIIDGNIRNIVFEALNTFLALATLVLIGLELLSFAWAGPAGLAIAAIGVVILLVQFIWNLLDPPPPPKDPVVEFVEGPLREQGYAT